MKRNLPVREANRLLLVILFSRLIMYTLSFYVLALVRLPSMQLMVLAVGPTAAIAALAVVNWYDNRVKDAFLKWILYLDIFVLSFQAMPYLLLSTIVSPEQAWIVSEIALVNPNILMLFSLVLVAWAYGQRATLWAATWAAALQGFASMLTVGTELFGWGYVLRQAVQILLYYAVPLMISALAERERAYLAELEETHDSLKRHAATVEQLAISQERNRLARDLHDTLTHSLAALSIHLEALRTLLARDPDAATQAADEAVEIARNGLVRSRQAIASLRVDPVAAEGLENAIRAELQALQSRSGLQTQLVVSGDAAELTIEESQTFFRILEEAITNAERHAKASQITVRLAYGADRTELVIADDGMGFDPARISEQHYGITGMRERAALIDAHLQITSHPHSGTQIWCALER